ncbi:MAG: glycoside hydrolase family 76 protein [Acidimicrobiales bacterium]
MLRRRRGPQVPDGATITAPADRAAEAWRALRDTSFARTGRDGLAVLDPPLGRRGPAAVWPLGQILAAGADLDLVGIADPGEQAALAGLLERYRGVDRTDGYGPFPGDRTRFFDDNAWVGLWFVQRHRQTGDPAALTAAAEVATFVARGQTDDGGVRWVDEATSPRNTCSTAPFAALALHLLALTGDEAWRPLGERALRFLTTTLRAPDALYFDHVDPDGSIDRAPWSYNQGTPVGAQVRWHLTTGDPASLDAAVETAGNALAFLLDDDRLWHQPPAFNAIFFRNLLQLHVVVPQPAALSAMSEYLDRAWATARDPRTGLLRDGGIGSYEGSCIDQAGFVQLFALQALGPPQWSLVT